MTQTVLTLLTLVVDGNLDRAQAFAKTMLEQNKTQKDAAVCGRLLTRLEQAQARKYELPGNLQRILAVEMPDSFPLSRFLLRPSEAAVIAQMLNIRKAAAALDEKGITFTPTLLLHGESGTGKSMLARYLAYKAQLPYIYIRFSGLIESLLGGTQRNLQAAFDFCRKNPCVLCLDELDTIGLRRGQSQDVAELSRVVVSLMQEMDNLNNRMIVVATTNRLDTLDEALVRRFSNFHEVLPLSRADTVLLCNRFFASVSVPTDGWLTPWCRTEFPDNPPASRVVNRCIEYLVDRTVSQMEHNEKEGVPF